MRKFVLAFSAAWLLMGLAVSPSTQATTTVLNFDTLPDGTAIPTNTAITNQYQAVGVQATGVYVSDAASLGYVATSRPNIAVSPQGLMTFSLDSAIIGNVQTVSAYTLGLRGTSIYAYDASGVQVGQAVLATDSNQTLLSVTSSGGPITTVHISGIGSTYAIDNLTFTSDVPFAKYSASVYLAPKLATFSATETFTLGSGSTGVNPPRQPVTLTLGSLTLSIPAGSFVQDMPPRTTSYVYNGTVNGGTLYVSISPTKTANTYQLFALGVGYSVPNGLTTMPVALAVGDNDGHTTVAPKYASRVPMSP